MHRTPTADPAPDTRLPPRETAAVAAEVLAPLVARGLILRRRRVAGLLERLDTESRAIRRLQRVRDRHGGEPRLLRVPGRTIVLVLSPEHARAVLQASPDPFTPANREKRAALERFQPHGVLISEGPARLDRRRFNEAVLDTAGPMHRLAPEIAAKVDEEADELLAAMPRSQTLDWDRFAVAWWRIVRRVVLGDAARDVPAATDMLAQLRADANWAYLMPARSALRDRFLRELGRWADAAQTGSLAALGAGGRSSARTHAVEQIPHWLFAFDAAGMAAFRTLALLAGHPEPAARAREEVAGGDGDAPRELPFLRASVLESLRLWPTTPAILRDATRSTRLGSTSIPAGAAVLIFTPFFHRDETRLPEADRFSPDIWLGPRQPDAHALAPFSAGPAACPGENLVLLVTTTLLARLLAERSIGPAPPTALRPGEPLPRTLEPFGLRIRLGA